MLILMLLTGVMYEDVQDFSQDDPARVRCIDQSCKKLLQKKEGKVCYASDCYEGDGFDKLASCVSNKCSGGDKWSFRVDAVSYDGQRFKAKATLSYQVATYGKIKAEAKLPVMLYLGVSVAKADGPIVDMPVIEMPAAKMNQPIELDVKVGAKAANFLVVVWNKKVTGCKVERPGCRDFGYALDDCAYSFPSGCFRSGTQEWATVPGGIALDLPDVKMVDAGGGAAAVKDAKERIIHLLEQSRKQPLRIVEGKARTPRKGIEVMARDPDPWSGELDSISQSLGAEKTSEWADAPAWFVIAVGK